MSEIRQLEDLTPSLQSELLALSDNPKHDIQDLLSWQLWQLDLIQFNGNSIALFTPRGAALVNDYQRRHENQGAASLKDWNDQDSREISDMMLRQVSDGSIHDDVTSVETLQAENTAMVKKLVDMLIESAVDPLGTGHYQLMDWNQFSRHELETLQMDGWIILSQPAWMIRTNSFAITDKVRELIIENWPTNKHYPLGITGVNEWIIKLDNAIHRPDGQHIWNTV